MNKINKIRFVTIFPRCENVHLIKDVGMIPYIMHKFYGYESTIVAYANERDLPYLNNEVKGLKYQSVKKTTNETRDFLKYIIKNAKKIDVLQLYHVTSNENYRWMLAYKILNPKGKIYLKLDAGKDITRDFDYNASNFKMLVKRYCLKKCKLISIETKQLAEMLSKEWNIKISYITNGYYNHGFEKIVSYDQKENIICTVGRLGSKQKNTEELIDAFTVFSENHKDWKLRLIGHTENNIEEYLERKISIYPYLKDRITLCGLIEDREQLKKEYEMAKIFCLTSRWESFAIVFVEALVNGCFIVSSDIDGARERIDNGKYGRIYPIEEKKQLISILSEIANNDDLLKSNCYSSQEYARENYYWPSICEKIDYLLRERV